MDDALASYSAPDYVMRHRSPSASIGLDESIERSQRTLLSMHGDVAEADTESGLISYRDRLVEHSRPVELEDTEIPALAELPG